jgi:hypothetical protein
VHRDGKLVMGGGFAISDGGLVAQARLELATAAVALRSESSRALASAASRAGAMGCIGMHS